MYDVWIVALRSVGRRFFLNNLSILFWEIHMNLNLGFGVKMKEQSY